MQHEPESSPTFDVPNPRHTLRRRAAATLLTTTLLCLPMLYVVQPVVLHKTITSVPAVDSNFLEADVRVLSSIQVPRDYLHPERLNEVATWIKERMEGTGALVSEQIYSVQGRTYRNVVARYGPASGKLIVVGAHYDVCGPNPGADDNASGIAGLLALARMLGSHPPSCPVELVAFTLEEPPFFRTNHMGSAHHAQGLISSNTAVKAMVCIEMIGTFSNETGSQRYPLPGMDLVYPSKGNFIAVIGGIGHGNLVRKVKAAMQLASTLPVWSMNAPSGLAGIDFSDHASFWKEGIPAVMVTDSAFYRNRWYHTGKDTPDRLDYGRMAQVVQGVFAAVKALED